MSIFVSLLALQLEGSSNGGQLQSRQQKFHDTQVPDTRVVWVHLALVMSATPSARENRMKVAGQAVAPDAVR